MAIDLNDLRTDIKDALAAAGLPAATDVKFLQVPGVLVGPVTDVEVSTDCAMSVTVPVLVVGRRPADEANVAVLNGWLPSVVAALQAISEVTEASLGTIEVGQGDMPAFLVPTIHVLKE